ncbi:MAG: invasion associated locus B family protein [Xanthobacteraceae bacterium]|nr:invasion associated locus B family protein [Xanthobacteraceae bacterium]QYK46377.1 MAG: invasion associated locus B family protein [Xanthobacteraceae bacterium]HMN50884.1 invasion associated locus B family protein [Xanthobacteraceae bacterium]
MKFRSLTAPVCAFLIAGFAAATVLSGTVPGFAQEKKTEKKKETKQKADPNQKDAKQPQQQNVLATKWTKICQNNDQTKKETCVVTQNLHAETGQMLAAVTVIEEKGAQKLFRIAVPLGMLLEPGLRVVVDQNQPIEAKYAICVPDGCFADLQVNDDFVAGLKKGKALIVQTINHVGRTVNITFPLTDFAKSYDGPPVDPKEIQAQRQKLEESMNKEAKKLLEQKKQ